MVIKRRRTPLDDRSVPVTERSKHSSRWPVKHWPSRGVYALLLMTGSVPVLERTVYTPLKGRYCTSHSGEYALLSMTGTVLVIERSAYTGQDW
jgi:hypothetical protein